VGTSVGTSSARGRRRGVTVLSTALVLAMIWVGAALGAEGNLPGGTAIDVTIDDPDGDVTVYVDDEGDTVDLTLTGTAGIGGIDVVRNTTLIYILDLSGSMTSGAGVDCTGNGVNDNRLRCQAEAVAFVNSLARQPGSPIGFTGVGSYATAGAIHNVDLDPDRPADRYLVAPEYDGDGDGTPDIEQVVRGLGTSGLTNFSAGLDQAIDLLQRSTTPVNRVVYISDGQPNRGSDVRGYAGEFDGFGTTRIDTFAITTGSGCANASSLGSLDDIAALTPGGTCTEVEDLADLNFVLGQVLSSDLTALTGTIDGGAPQPMTTVSPALPQEGPATVDYVWEAGAFGVGSYEFCVTATGVDGGGEGSVTQCRIVTIAVPDPLAEGLHLAPETAGAAVGNEHSVTATLVDSEGDPVADAEIAFEVTDGPHVGTNGTATTDEDGRATFAYEGDEVGTDSIVATHTPEEGDDVTSNTVTVDWTQVLAEAVEADDADDETEEVDDVEEIEEADAADAVEAQPDFTG
jgi:trimeric autotransporter adhesin